MSLPAAAERRQLLALLGELEGAIEDLLLTGLSAATAATRSSLEQCFRSTAQLRLLRLGATLRIATEELARYAAQDAAFSRKRLAFFLHRSWMLGRALARALAAGNEARWDTLNRAPAPSALAAGEFVCLGVGRRRVPGAFCAFEFRLRRVDVPRNEAVPVQWSCVFPLQPGAKPVRSEVYLQLKQKQGFRAADWLAGKVMRIERAQLAADGATQRLSLGADSGVSAGGAWSGWADLPPFDPVAARARLAAHRTTPFDLDVELQEEVLLPAWSLGEVSEEAEAQRSVHALHAAGLELGALVPADDEHEALRGAFAAARTSPPDGALFGLLHYEACRVVLQPLSLITASGPKYINLGDTKTGAAELLKTLKF